MRLNDLLQQKQAAIQVRWLELILETYPVDSRDFFQKQKNRFLNPVGAALSRQVEALLGWLLTPEADHGVTDLLDEFVKIRAVQDYTPAQALGYILFLKDAIRQVLSADLRTPELYRELLELEARIDRLLLAAFNVFMHSREKIYEIKANSARRESYLALRRAGVSAPQREPLDNVPD